MNDNEQNNKWQKFCDSGLMWWINRQLHLFGWAIYRDLDEQGNIISIYPDQCDYKGFTEELEEKGFSKLTNYLVNNISKELKKIKGN